MTRYILGIESSCDETAVALVDESGRLVADGVASQVDLHARFGGVVPEVAARMHIQACLPLVEQTLADAGAGWDAIEAVAATRGPGLIGCLLVGFETAKTLAWLRGKPLIAVNHLAGHLYAPLVAPLKGAHLLAEGGEQKPAWPIEPGPDAPLDEATREKLVVAKPPYPHVGLIVSGGHTSLVWVEAPDRVEIIAETRDDAAGEAFDKVARVAGLGYPGGPVIDRLAAEGDPSVFALSPPMMRKDKPGFSFSGLKTAAGRIAEKLLEDHDGNVPEQVMKDFCAAFQSAAVGALMGKSLDAVKARKAHDLVISGGVACNRGLRRAATEATRRRKLRVWFPHPSLCTDNAAMIAGLAWRLEPLDREQALTANAVSSWPLGTA